MALLAVEVAITFLFKVCFYLACHPAHLLEACGHLRLFSPLCNSVPTIFAACLQPVMVNTRYLKRDTL